jgi:hypothetical protein
MPNTDIFLGSGASLTLVPEVDLYIKLHADTAGADKTVAKLHADLSGLTRLVQDIYVGCQMDFYDNGTYTSTHTITANDDDEITFIPKCPSTIVIADDYFIIRGYGAPCFGPKSGSTARLNADNWVGVLESAQFPNVETEVKQMNLSLGGSRNMTYQFKGIETASGGNLNVVANHGAWLYYALGACSTVTCTYGAQAPASDFVGNTASDVYIDTANAGGGTTSVTTHVNTGPIFYKTASSSDKTLMPPALKGSDIYTNLELLTRTTSTATATVAPITYTFTEANDANLPSFSLEQTLSKLPSSNTYVTDTTADLEDLNFVRIARGNRVSSFTMTANESEEVKMTMDLSTRTVHKLKQTEAYEARGGQATNTSLFNFAPSGDAELLEPFFFSSGSFSAFGQQFLKVTNFSLTINNNLQDKRFVGAGSTSIQEAIPANRMYEMSFTAMVTDDLLFEEFFNRTENTGTSVVTSGTNFATAGKIDLQFDKLNGEEINISFENYFLESANFTIPDDKGPITVEALVRPRDLDACTVKTHWVLQG